MDTVCQHETAKRIRGMCESCYRKWLRHENPQKAVENRERVKLWKRAHPDLWKAQKLRKKARDPEKWRERRRARLRRRRERLGPFVNHLLVEHGLRLDQYEEMLASQDGKCAICRDAVRLIVDHCHTTNKRRGLLCNPCNMGLGFFRDDPVRFENAIAYLNKFREGVPIPLQNPKSA